MRATVNVNYDYWTSSKLSAAIVQIMIEERLGHGVQLTANSGAPSHVYEQLASGTADVATEVWPEGKMAEFAAHASWNDASGRAWAYEQHRVLTGVKILKSRDGNGQILSALLSTSGGIASYSQLAVAEGDASAKQLCADASNGVSCDADGIYRPPACKGEGVSDGSCAQLLHVSPVDSQGVLEAHIAAQNLPLTVAYVGYEALISKATQAWETSTPLLFYWPSPSIQSGGVGGLPATAFEEVLSAGAPVDEPMQKLMSPTLEARAPDVAALVRALQLTNLDYADLMHREAGARAMGAAPADAAWLGACAWLRLHEPVWTSWIAFPSRPPRTLNMFPNACLTASGCFDGKSVSSPRGSSSRREHDRSS